MATIAVDDRALTASLTRLRTFANDAYQQAITAGAERAGAKLDELVRTTLPPPRPSSGPSPLVTDKQRRWWWATMHAKARGKSRALPGWKAVYKRVDGRKTLVISGGYRRTGKLVQSFTWQTVAMKGGAEVRYGTNRAYAPYVVGDPDDPDKRRRQARIHQGNWQPLILIAQQGEGQIAQAFIDGAHAAARRLLEG